MMLALSLEMMPSRLEELKPPMISIMSLRPKYNLNLRISLTNLKVLAGGRGRGYFKENNFEGGVHIQYTPDNVTYHVFL